MAANFFTTMLNTTISNYPPLPPLPAYTLQIKPNFLPFISDVYLSTLAPIVGYWTLSLFFHYIDVNDIWPEYRLHTPAEILKRNRATRYEVARDVIFQQVLQLVTTALAGLMEEAEQIGKEGYDIAIWARRIRIAQRALPSTLSIFGLNAAEISKNISPTHPIIAGLLAGGNYSLTAGLDVTAFAGWELFIAKAIYWFIIPLFRFILAILLFDTWQYFGHRAMHMNKWLYNNVHSRHHKLYVTYAFGAVYNHPLEGFLMDTLGATICSKVAGISTLQVLFFFTVSNLKTVDDHCGYSLPWDPFQYIFSNNCAYHDIHHQTWGIKTNFSQPFFTFWDVKLGTVWKGGDISKRMEKSRKAAQLLVDIDNLKKQ